MFRLRKLTLARSQNSCGAGGGDGVPFGIFLAIIKGWSGLELSLTCRQGDFAEDLSEEGIRNESVRDELTRRCRHTQDAYKMPVGPIAGPRPLLVQIGRLGNGAYDKIDVLKPEVWLSSRGPELASKGRRALKHMTDGKGVR